MKLLFVFVFAASTFIMPIEKNATVPENILAADNELPRTIRVCWEIFGGEILCLTVEESFIGGDFGDEINAGVRYSSTGDSMTLKMPTKKSGVMTAQETVSFKVKGEKKTIRKGTKIRVRNGVAKISLGG